MNPMFLIIITTGIIYSALLFIKPKLSFLLLIFLCILNFSWFSRYFNAPDYLQRLVFLIAILCGIKIFSDLLTKRIIIKKTDIIIKTIVIFTISLCALVIITNTINNESLVFGFFEIRFYFIMVILVMGLNYYDIIIINNDVLIKIFVIIGLAQIPFSTLQYVLAGGGSDRTLDSVCGTFNSYAPLVANQILAIALLLSHKLKTGKNMFGINSYFLLILLIFPLLISKSRSSNIYIILMVSFVFYQNIFSLKKGIKVSLFLKNLPILVLILLIIATLFFKIFWKNYDINKQFSIDYVISYFTRTAGGSKDSYKRDGPRLTMGRAMSVIMSAKIIRNNYEQLFFGYGSGSISESKLLKKKGHLYQWHGPLAGLNATQYAKIISEFGIMGCCLFLYPFLKIKREMRQKIKNQSTIDSYNILLFLASTMCFYTLFFESFHIIFILSIFFCNIQKQLDVIESRPKI